MVQFLVLDLDSLFKKNDECLWSAPSGLYPSILKNVGLFQWHHLKFGPCTDREPGSDPMEKIQLPSPWDRYRSQPKWT